jgi:predicted  nucleic acid-binding Zn-ribbon protein
MGPVLHGLMKLQSVENQLRAIKAKIVRSRRNVLLQENRVRSLQNALDAKKEEVQLTKIQSSRLELDLKTRDEAIAKYRAALNTAKTNREYAAVLTELNTNKADSTKLENQLLDLMKNIETDEKDCTEIARQVEEEKQRLETIRKESDEKVAVYESQIQGVQNDWDSAASSIPAEPLHVFKRVADTYDGEALATVEQQDGRVQIYSCGGCFMGVPTDMANLLMTRDEVIRCPNCTRILVLKTSE